MGRPSPFSVTVTSRWTAGAGAEIGGRVQHVQAVVGQFVCVDIAADPAGFRRFVDQVADEVVQPPMRVLDVLSPVQLGGKGDVVGVTGQ